MRQYWNEGWTFSEVFNEEMLNADCLVEMTAVRLPHTTKEVPYHYFDEEEYQMLCGYRKVFYAEKEWKDKSILLTFDGVGHACEIYLNGKKIGEHRCGYTAVTVDLAQAITYEQENVLTVKVDSRESLNVPPFGFVIDYMTFGGIYRDVYLDIREKSFIRDVFHMSRLRDNYEKAELITEIMVEEPVQGMSIRQSIREWGKGEYQGLANAAELSAAKDKICLSQSLEKVKLWDTENPNLYEIRTELLAADGKVVDEKTVRFGFREAIFKPDGFYLNGKKTKIRGLNRHQSYPYIGYAAPASLQKNDADILKNELGLNAVRTSHYPQSHYFMDRCDEIGLMVFTEMPGWQNIGDSEWKDQAVQNTRDMVLQYRNHTSIILWGVRINESVDDDEFYIRTNEAARKLDPSRQTGGVRCYKKSSLLEDVYTYNDFSHEGTNKGCEPKAAVTSDMNKPYMITEYNGHMFPTKPFDWEEKRCEHAIRHATVLDEVAAQEGIAGSFGWCMFDYNTHKDFGSGDRICYHGVMDMFRNPKLAAYVYTAQQEKTPVLEISSSFDIGEHPGCNRGDIYIFTNADQVRMYKNGALIKEYGPEDSTHKHLAHGPIRVNDYIGDALEKGEGISHKQAEEIKELLNETARFGLYRLSKKQMLKAAWISMRYHMKMTDAVQLFNKYIGNWGGESTAFTFEAVKNGKVVLTKTLMPMKKMTIDAVADHTELTEEHSYDMAMVRITAKDELGNILPFCNDPLKLSAQGAVELIGPELISLAGGMGGTYVRTKGIQGEGSLIIETANGYRKEIKMTVKI